MLFSVRQKLRALFKRSTKARKWAAKTLVVGPSEPVDGDSVACTKALINHLRKLGLDAYTLPTITMYPQLQWILEPADLHPACRQSATARLTTDNLQQAYDTLLEVWRPDEIVVVDGQDDRLGFDRRGVPTFTIDHHLDHGTRDDETACIQSAPSAGCLLVSRFGVLEPILAVSILTDTFWLRQNQPARAIESLCALYHRGGLTDEVLTRMQRLLMVPKDPQVISELRTCDLRSDGDTVFAVLRTARPDIHRDCAANLGYYFRHLCVVRADGYVSFRTDSPNENLPKLAARYGGGGHSIMAATHLASMEPALLDRLHQDFLEAVHR